MRAAGESLKSDVNWKSIGATAAADAISGAFGMTVAEFSKWITEGTLPKDGLGGRSKAATKGGSSNAKGYSAYHSGGIVGTTGARTGVPGSAPRRPSEIDARLKIGEAVLNRNAVSGLGHDFVNDLNAGRVPAMGGPDLGMSGLIGAGIAGMMRSVIQSAVQTAGNRSLMNSGSFMSGNISGVKMSAEQLSNAAAIVSAGKSFGASQRDLVIALMTALQESTLRNLSYGDRDSIGLFQQRDAWGSRAARMDPYQATRMFFYGGAAGQRGLFDFKNRDKMSLTQAAQAVQVSAFPNAYAKWEGLARQLLGGYSSTGAVGGGAFMKPVSGRISSEYGMRKHPITGNMRLHNGIDIAAPGGSIIRASSSGGVQMAKYSGGYGNFTVLNHPGGIQTGYAHQSRFLVSKGQNVSKGQPIGAVGSTGSSTGNHLHFMVGMNGSWVNPRKLVPGLMDGGFTLNTGLAQLHPNEAVLTKPLTQELKDGIRNIDSSSQNVYNINVDARGSTMTEEEFTRATKKALLEIEVSRGVKRKVGSR